MKNVLKKSKSGDHNLKNGSDEGLHNLSKKLKRKQNKSLIKNMRSLPKDHGNLRNEINEIVHPITIKTVLAKKSKKKKKKNIQTNEPKAPGTTPLLRNFFDSNISSDHNSDDSNACDEDLFPTQKTLKPEDCSIKHGPLMYNPELLALTKPLQQREKRFHSLENKNSMPVCSENDLVEYQNAPSRQRKRNSNTRKVNEETMPVFTETDPDSYQNVSIGLVPELEQVQPVKFYDIPNKKFLVILKHPTTLFFQGQLNVKVLFGSLEVLGCTITSKTQESVAVFSPGGSSLLGLHALQHDDSKDNVEHCLDKLGVDSEVSRSIIDDLQEENSLFLIDKVHSTFSKYLASQCSIYLYPRTIDVTRQFCEEENKLQCQFETRSEKLSRSYSKPRNWDDLASRIVVEMGESKNRSCTGPHVMVCGGKSVGKSTLLRFLINKSLSRIDDVLFLDFDPGQSEFTVPGCVSVVRVSEPLLGPNFTHLMTAQRMVYVGDVNVNNCPDRYIQSAQHIIDYCQSKPEYKNMVWFINTMGFSKGLGVELTASLIQMVKPTHLVQIQSRLSKRNFPDLLTAVNVGQHQNRWKSESTADNIQLNYSHIVLESVAENNKKDQQAVWGLQAKTARTIVFLAYVNQMLAPPRNYLTDVVPFKIPLAGLKLSICHETVHYSQYLNVMNANLVALCSIDECDENILKPDDPTLPCILAQPPVAPCLGFGIVRGVDIVERMVYLLTPLAERHLRAVNCLVKGSEMLPACVYTAAAAGNGHIPYVATGPGQATSKGIGKRFFLPLKN